MPRQEDRDEPEVEAVEVPETIASPVTPEPVAKKTAVVVMAGASIPAADIKIVVESRKYSGGSDDQPLSVEVKKTHYPAGADFYLRYDPEVQFPKDAPEVLTMGDNVQQMNFRGFTRQVGMLNVGPAHPAFAAANLAYQHGATDITIVGLTDAEKELLRPYLDGLPNEPVDPAQVTVSLS